MNHEEFVKDAMRMMRRDAEGREDRNITEMLFDEFLLNAARDGMLQKLKAAREKGRGGWWNQDECSIGYLKELLCEHLAKGDMRDVMNLAAMIHVRTIADEAPMTDEPKAAMSVPHIKIVAIFDPGCTTLGEDLDRLNDRLINLLDHEFPRHNGLGMTVELVDENDPDAGSLLEAERAHSDKLAEALEEARPLETYWKDYSRSKAIADAKPISSALASHRERRAKHHPNCSDPTRTIGEGMCCCDRERRAKGVE